MGESHQQEPTPFFFVPRPRRYAGAHLQTGRPWGRGDPGLLVHPRGPGGTASRAWKRGILEKKKEKHGSAALLRSPPAPCMKMRGSSDPNPVPIFGYLSHPQIFSIILGSPHPAPSASRSSPASRRDTALAVAGPAARRAPWPASRDPPYDKDVTPPSATTQPQGFSCKTPRFINLWILCWLIERLSPHRITKLGADKPLSLNPPLIFPNLPA